jgi:hypothetical protein
MMPEPVAICPPVAAADVVAAAAIPVVDETMTVAIVVAAAGGADATIPAVEPVPFCAIAICLNIA